MSDISKTNEEYVSVAELFESMIDKKESENKVFPVYRKGPPLKITQGEVAQPVPLGG